MRIFSYKGCGGNHAYILVEGLKGVEDFMYIAHFTGAVIESYYIDAITLRKEEMTPEIKQDSLKVEKMIKSIEKQRGKELPFSYFGNLSILGRIVNVGAICDNCFTWASDKLKKADIDLEKNYLDYIIALVRTKTFSDQAFENTHHPDDVYSNIQIENTLR